MAKYSYTDREVLLFENTQQSNSRGEQGRLECGAGRNNVFVARPRKMLQMVLPLSNSPS